MTLTGRQYQQLTDAFVNSFPTKAKLELFVKNRLDKNLDAIAMGDDLTEIIFKVIRTAEAEGWVEELVAVGRDSNPRNPRLFAFAQELNLTSAPPVLVPETIIRETNSFLDVNKWQERLGEIEAQVCRIEITTNQYREFSGTGFLIAPNVVVTNYHVMKPVIEKQAAPSNVILRFDYKELGNHRNLGTEYRLAENWLIDYSPSVRENRLPQLDELDYALLRVQDAPGQEPIGKNPEPGSSKRGWIKLPTESHEFLPNTPLFIVQHPKGKPLKLALDTNAIIGVNPNRTRVTYKTNTLPGSSGSPCFDANWNLVALHHSGDSDSLNPTYNTGTPFSAICSLLDQRGILKSLSSNQPI